MKDWLGHDDERGCLSQIHIINGIGDLCFAKTRLRGNSDSNEVNKNDDDEGEKDLLRRVGELVRLIFIVIIIA